MFFYRLTAPKSAMVCFHNPAAFTALYIHVGRPYTGSHQQLVSCSQINASGFDNIVCTCTSTDYTQLVPSRLSERALRHIREVPSQITLYWLKCNAALQVNFKIVPFECLQPYLTQYLNAFIRFGDTNLHSNVAI